MAQPRWVAVAEGEWGRDVFVFFQLRKQKYVYVTENTCTWKPKSRENVVLSKAYGRGKQNRTNHQPWKYGVLMQRFVLSQKCVLSSERRMQEK